MKYMVAFLLFFAGIINYVNAITSSQNLLFSLTTTSTWREFKPTLAQQTSPNENDSKIGENSTLLDYLLNFLFKALNYIHDNNIQPTIKNEIIFDTSYVSFDVLKNALSKIEVRRELFEKGKKSVNKFLENGIQELS